MTEMKRVPYRIMAQQEDAGIFEEFSVSSGLEKPSQVGAGLLPVPQQIK